ncbi:unnamed protein product [Eretmochelys imbricata]
MGAALFPPPPPPVPGMGMGCLAQVHQHSTPCLPVSPDREDLSGASLEDGSGLAAASPSSLREELRCFLLDTRGSKDKVQLALQRWGDFHHVLWAMKALLGEGRGIRRQGIVAYWRAHTLAESGCGTSVKYVGHIMSQEDVSTDPDKIEALTPWPWPSNYRELKTFLGFSGYYHRFVKNYATIVKPLNDLTRGHQPSKNKSKTKNKGRSPKPPVQRLYGAFEPFGLR